MSPVLTDSRRQMTLAFDNGLVTRFRNLRECVAQGVYQRGLTWVAGELDMSPGNLSSELGDESQRKFGIDELEAYIARTGDKAPIYYLVSKFLGDEAAARDEALAQVQALLQRMPDLLMAAGVASGTPASARSGRGRA